MRPGVLLPPIPPKIALVGEAWGQEELVQKAPFVGTSGRELRDMTKEAELSFEQCLVTNVFCRRPRLDSNELRHLCGPDRPSEKPFSIPLVHGPTGYLREEFHSEVHELWKELADVNVVVALGNTAIWALLGTIPTVGSMRGTFWRSPYIKAKVLPTYHPAAVVRAWSLRTIVLLDLIKARNFSESREINRPSRLVYINPDLDELYSWKNSILSWPLISIDLENESPSRKTRDRYITCISFAPDSSMSYVVPFVKDGWKHYWSTTQEELEAWEIVREICESPIPKLFQKHLFDTYVLRRSPPYISVGGYIHDTLHLHHALYPEIQKDLGFLGSVYTEEPAWKLERPKGKKGQEKRDD